MTLALAWVRKVTDCEELVIASDSRLSGGRNIDCCQKILALPRSDAFICFAGESQFAYPLMQQVYMAILSYNKASDGSQDLHELRGHVVKIFNRLMESVTSPIQEMRTPDATFLFGGYSWIQKQFSIWTIRYHEVRKEFIYGTPRRGPGGALFAIAGDLKVEATRRLMANLRQRGISLPHDATFGFDWEPLDILFDLLREKAEEDLQLRVSSSSIGGAPQIMKVYQHMNCRPIGVYWPDRASDQIFIAGRKLLGYEKPDIWILDPDTKMSSHVPLYVPRVVDAETADT